MFNVNWISPRPPYSTLSDHLPSRGVLDVPYCDAFPNAKAGWLDALKEDMKAPDALGYYPPPAHLMRPVTFPSSSDMDQSDTQLAHENNPSSDDKTNWKIFSTRMWAFKLDYEYIFQFTFSLASYPSWNMDITFVAESRVLQHRWKQCSSGWNKISIISMLLVNWVLLEGQNRTQIFAKQLMKDVSGHIIRLYAQN